MFLQNPRFHYYQNYLWFQMTQMFQTTQNFLNYLTYPMNHSDQKFLRNQIYRVDP
jgi:hypothetical protein